MPIHVASPRRLPGLAAALRAIVTTALALEDRRPGEIAIVLTDDAALRDLNLRYRSIDRATDVLSFGYDEASPSTPNVRVRRPRAVSLSGAPLVNGDLVISMDRMDDQAKRYRTGRGRELARLVIHGALHLAGLDHKAPAERKHMRAREARALKACASRIAPLERILDEQGIKAPMRKNPPKPRAVTVPDDLMSALRKSKKALAAFEGFSPSHRREYVEWITEAKADATRRKRLETAVEWMSEGKNRHWKYARK